MSVSVAERAQIAPGSVVVVRDEEWLVLQTTETADGLLVHAQGLGELVRDVTASFYEALDDITPLDPKATTVVADDSPRYRTARLWLESTLRKTAVPLGDRTLTVSRRALADRLGYQQTAVRQALDPESLRPRILLADAVGLGKTLEIGMILSELVRRGRGERILIVSPRHVLEQMQHEMWTRFALPFVRLDSVGIQRVRQRIPATRNPFTYYKRAIISIDTLKADRYVSYLRNQRWDAVVIDESHNLTNPSTQNNRLARQLARTSEALILASATPHNGRKESFAELIRLLDPAAVSAAGEFDDDAIKRLVVRRHRHSPEVASVVGTEWAERQEPNNLLIPASPAEDAIAHELETTWLFPESGASPYSGATSALFPWTLAKAFLSSPAAIKETVVERCRRLVAGRAVAGPAADRERAALDRLHDLAEDALAAPTAKYGRLLAHLREIGVGPGSPARAVVFAERVATLRWLQAHLPDDLGIPPNAVDLLHGGLGDDEQQRVVEDFRQAHTPVRVLVTGDVASEGVNLHAQCHELIHYDIPWSLIRIEQRNGRIDRYGQRHAPRITTLLLEPSSERFAGDLRVLTRLVEREHEAHRALGDVASLMGRYDVKAEEDDIRSVLAGQRDLGDVVQTPAEVADSDSVGGFFARWFGLAADTEQPETAGTTAATTDGDTTTTTATRSGLYTDDISYLEDALDAAFVDKSAPPTNAGVAWRYDAAAGIAEFDPTRDLAQRLEVLPQSYLADRRVTERLVLATTFTRGQERLRAALRDSSASSWPDAHYLSPLHPVLDWAADRALANLGRNEVFAVRGTVDNPTVLLLGTLTNRRGQVMAATWLSAQFAGAAPLVEPYESPRDMLADIGWHATHTNPGGVSDIDKLQSLIAPAVDAAGAQMRLVFQASAANATQRIEQWLERLRGWDADAEKLAQRKEIRTRRGGVVEERELVASMSPDRQLVRPLLVVVPQTAEAAPR